MIVVILFVLALMFCVLAERARRRFLAECDTGEP